MNVGILYLVTGEELIGEIIENEIDPDYIIVKNPMKLLITPKGVALTNLGLLSKKKEKIHLYKTHVIYITEPEVELKKEYEAAVSGIIRPTGPNLGLVQ